MIDWIPVSEPPKISLEYIKLLFTDGVDVSVFRVLSFTGISKRFTHYAYINLPKDKENMDTPSNECPCRVSQNQKDKESK